MPELDTPLRPDILPILWAVAKAAPASSGSMGRFFWYLGFTLLAGAIVIGVIWARHVWEGVHETEEPTSNEEMLDELRRAYAAGTMSEAEFCKVSELLSGPTPAPKKPERPTSRQAPDPTLESEAAAPAGGEAPPSGESEPA